MTFYLRVKNERSNCCLADMKKCLAREWPKRYSILFDRRRIMCQEYVISTLFSM